MIFCIAINNIYKREYLSLSQKTACLMAGGFLSSDVCVHVPAYTGAWLL